MTEISDVDSFDALARDLQECRCSAGMPSYAEIARRIGDTRATDTISSVAARPARSTVYDAFRTGRSRMNPDLLAEIVLALGHTEAEADRWRQRCQHLRATTETPHPARPVRSAPTLPPHPELQEPVSPGREGQVSPGYEEPALPADDGDARTTQGVPTDPSEGDDARPLPGPSVFLIGLAVNALGYYLVGLLHLPVYLDMIGTGYVAISLGPWWGVLVAGLTNILGTTLHGSTALPFFAVSGMGAILWGYGARMMLRRSSISRFLLLNIVVAVACSCIATPLKAMVFHGHTDHTDYALLADTSPPGFLAEIDPLVSNLSASMTDKLLSGFLILALLEVTRRHVSSPASRPTTGVPEQESVRHRAGVC
jgi:energy-coupling factor transport system substrate-specific component